MLNFLRKLRKGNSTKYLKYAIGEIFLVVIGILIALSINNWNEERKKSQEEKVILKSIRDEFERNLQTLQVSIDRAEQRQAYCVEIIQLTSSEKAEMSKSKSDELIFGGLASHVTVELSDSYLKDLLSTGKIHYIQNERLKTLLIEWGKDIAEIREDEGRIFEERSRLIKPFLLEHYSYASDFREDAYGFKSRFNQDYKSIYKVKQLEDLAIDKAGQYLIIHRAYLKLKEDILEIISFAQP